MNTLLKYGRRRICELGLIEEGMATTEYAIILGLLVIAVLATLLLFGDGLVSTFNYFAKQFADASSDQFPAGKTLAADSFMMAYASPPAP